MASRTFGWVQDSTELTSLRSVVEVFKYGSTTNSKLRAKRIPGLVVDDSLAARFIGLLSSSNITIPYRDLVGGHATPRGDSTCDGIIQAAIPGQKRDYIADWPADNYLRWAHCLGLINFEETTDSFSISELGTKFINTSRGSQDEESLLSEVLLSYPPVLRMLDLLSQEDGLALTKFEIGKQLGFVGEDGFTSFPQSILVKELATATSAEERRKLSNSEGTSDKYVRTMASWCIKMGWIEKSPKEVVVSIGGVEYSHKIGQAYIITHKGLSARRRGRGINIQQRVPRRVLWEMLSTKAVDRDYIRNRRAYLVKSLASSAKSLEQIEQKLTSLGFVENAATILDDIQGLINIGLHIDSGGLTYRLKDQIMGLDIPPLTQENSTKSEVRELIDKCRSELKEVPHEYLALIEMSFNGEMNRLFETKTLELFLNEYGFLGTHLGGTNKPDGIIFTDGLTENYGVIIDTKAYERGFNIPVSEKRKMIDYVMRNQLRDRGSWWKGFPDTIVEYKFLFVSSQFGGNFKSQLKEVCDDTNGTRGAVIAAYDMVLLADKVKRGMYGLDEVGRKLGSLERVEA